MDTVVAQRCREAPNRAHLDTAPDGRLHRAAMPPAESERPESFDHRRAVTAENRGHCADPPHPVPVRAPNLTSAWNRAILELAGGVLVSTMRIRRRRHAEDGSLASLNIEPKIKANQELALAA